MAWAVARYDLFALTLPGGLPARAKFLTWKRETPMAFDAMFKHGNPLMIDFSPPGFVAAGTVLSGVAGGIATVVVHHDLEAGVVALGAVAAGGGVYEMVNGDNSPNFAKVGWDNATKKVSAAGTAKFGYVVSLGGRGINSTCYVMHDPTGA
jgi:hypothetical protein